MTDDALFDLHGKVALVTGGSRGLGREIVRAYAARGADVVIASRRLDSCEALAERVQSDTGRAALPVAADVGSWSDCERLVDAAYERFGRVDVLVNNAGMSPVYPSPDAVSEALWDKVTAVNVKGPFRLTALIGARMVEGDGGAIVNISSTNAIRPSGDALPYAAAKAGLNALTVGFAQALGPKVRVNAIVCGAFLTDLSAAWDMEAVEKLARRRFALRRIAQPEEVVGAAVYLASSASSFCTGALLRLDGGLS
jgi:NAD(P)-dependent dehydrogenase (short-subunit alcohol dehydrogenase family)